MPPKKGRSRPQPYSTSLRRSARQGGMSQTGTQVRDTDQVIVSPPSTENQSSTSTGGTVSRLEFDNMKASLEGIKQLLNNVITLIPNTLMQGQSSSDTPSTSSSSAHPQGESATQSQQSGSMADSVVDQAVSQHINTLINNKQGKVGSDPISHQIDRKVPHKLMLEIWEDKFIDFNNLIEQKSDPTQPLTLVQSKSGEPQFIPSKNSKTISSIGQWCRAFDIFLSIYSRKFPSETHNLLTYSAKVKDLAFRGGTS